MPQLLYRRPGDWLTELRDLIKMEIIWLGHSCFRLRSEDLVVVTDPFPDSIGLKPDPRPVTAVTISNIHPNHSNWQEVVGGPQVFQGPGEYEYSGIAVRGVMTPLSQGYDLTTRNTAFCIQLDGLNICHLGDINCLLYTSPSPRD